jgi:hypothetical protein
MTEEPYFLGDGRTDAETAIIDALRGASATWQDLNVPTQNTQAWTDRDALYVHVDLVDRDENLVYATLRIDFDGDIAAGHWGDAQFQEPIASAGVDTFHAEGTPTALAQAAVAWISEQLRRPVERLEWSTKNGAERLWRFADTGRELARRNSGPAFAAGGAWDTNRPGQPPDRVTVLRPDRRRSTS